VVRELVARLEDRLRRGGERLERVARHEERGGQVVALEHLQQSRHADARAVLAALQHGGGHVLVAEPDGHRVEVERQADGGARHGR
jgi:hypothetical protein